MRRKGFGGLVNDEKYIVFKLSDWADGVERLGELAQYIEGIPPVEDAVVIRKQDMFAGPGLHAYAMTIQTAIETTRLVTNGMTAELICADLEKIRDYFTQQALEAEACTTKKMPTP